MNLTVILGQTCSGKTGLSIDLAHYYQSIGQSVWIVGCDSRQIYQSLNIGTAKISGEWSTTPTHQNLPISRPAIYQNQQYLFEGISHFFIDYIDPKTEYSLLEFLLDFTELFNSLPASHLPNQVILTGGTGLWAQAIVDQYQLGVVRDEYQIQYQNLQKELNEKSLQELQQLYQNLQKEAETSTFKELNESDFANSRRLISTIIRSKTSDWIDPIIYPTFETTRVFAISRESEDLKNRITTRIHERIEQGLLDEVKSLQYLGRKRLLDLGLEYRQTQLFLEGELSESNWIDSLITKNIQYAKRQKTWLNRMKGLVWVEGLGEILSVG